MKKIISLLVFAPFFINAQSLEYNRTIDTVLSITIAPNTNFNNSNKQIIGDYISAPSNKVWKVQSIIIFFDNDKDTNSNTALRYQGSVYGTGSLSEIGARIELMIKNNGFENSLYSKEITTNQKDFQQIYTSPIWINNSELGIAFTHTRSNGPTNYNPYINQSFGSYSGYIHFSIIEFNTN